MIKTITFGKEFRGFKSGFQLELRPGVNLLVGDQGCGKSTLLTALQNGATFLPQAAVAVAQEEGTKIRYFDFEKFNPRTSTAFGGDVDMSVQTRVLFTSHGQAVVLMLADLCKRNASQPITFLLDEPDTGLSVRSARAVGKFFRILAAQGHQVIAAVHNPMLFLLFEEVYSVEHKQWMKGNEFLATQMG